MPYKYEYNEFGGVWGTLDYNTGTLTIDDQGVSAFAIMGLEFQDYPYWLDWKYYNPGNLFLCQTCDSYGNNATAVTGTFVETLEHTGNTYWHKNCGGDLKTVYKTGFSMSPWRVFKDFDQASYRGVLTSGTATSMSIEEDQTFDAAISSVTIAHDPANDYTEELDPVSGQMVKKGFYRVKVKMGNFVNKDNVDYVDLYCIEGSHTHCGTVSHADGVGYIGSVGVSAPAASLGEFPVYPSIIRDAEGNPVYENGKVKVNKDLTFYLKAHYKTSASSAPGEKTAAPLESTFHALTTRTANDITTAVDLSEATGLNVEDVEGGIIVHAEGNAAVQVYNMSGMLVAAGNTNETIAIDATGVMVVRVNGKVFKIMK